MRDDEIERGLGYAETIIHEVGSQSGDARIRAMALDRGELLDVVALALTERANTGPLHCANAPGTFAYHYGTFALRDRNVTKGWVTDRTDGLESMRHVDLMLKVAFCNVDITCERGHVPRPRSEKGAGVERAASWNLFGDTLPHFAPRTRDRLPLFYLMVGEDGRAELTRPVVQGGTFAAAIERIFIGHYERDREPEITLPSAQDTENYDPMVTLKIAG